MSTIFDRLSGKRLHRNLEGRRSGNSKNNLLRTEQTISGITGDGQDIGMIIESVVECCTIDRNLRVCAVEMLDTFRCGNETDELNIFNLSHFEEIDGRCRRTACREHGSSRMTSRLLNVLGQFAVILNGLKRDGIAIKSYMPNFGHRNKIRHTVNHSQAGTQDWNKRNISPLQHMAMCHPHGGFDFNRS